MRIGSSVKLKPGTVHYLSGDRHNPTDKSGIITEINANGKIIVNWGNFRNSYSKNDLIEV